MLIPKTGWHLAHVGFISAWASLVIVETILEVLGGRDPRLKQTVARFHYFFDLILEIPLLIGVLTTGILLTSFTNIDSNLILKITCALITIALNFICVALVMKRWSLSQKNYPEENLKMHSRWIQRTTIGIPFALVALWIGAKRGGWF